MMDYKICFIAEPTFEALKKCAESKAGITTYKKAKFALALDGDKVAVVIPEQGDKEQLKASMTLGYLSKDDRKEYISYLKEGSPSKLYEVILVDADLSKDLSKIYKVAIRIDLLPLH